ncbi:glycosyltransferase family 4 protein [Sphingomonas sp. SUN019]|uniref:glycosyltransferase family 4 protein n=1 Tax=Sphingomonas sp. SUN019 TaxID=2937788 RepID=UPI002164E93C|nr:glycosyltransferase family 1 protein [Sphingomonas sp. SUN019]UVO52382.1 glycosyltransferase family 4 protein [Sphingomonas sp. SUN019]
MGDDRASAPAVGIDGFNLALTHGTGVATYGFSLAEAARSLGMRVEGLFGVPVGRDPRLREILFYEAMGRGLPNRQSPRWLRPAFDRWAVARGLPVLDIDARGQVERRSFGDRLPAFDRLRSAAFLFERADAYFKRTRRFLTLRIPDPPEIMHWTYPVPLRIDGARNIYTLHDLVPLKLPFATLDRKRLYHRLVERCVTDGDHIVTVSESSRRDVITMLGCAEDRITNTYQHAAMPPDVLGGQDVADVAAIFGVRPGAYFLYFGAIEPKKNIARMVEAYLSTSSDTPLVIVGARAWQKDEEMRLVDSVARGGGAASKRIIQLDYLPRRLLMNLVTNARAVLFPSLYEGFGLPVLEAMTLGTPVVTSIMGSLPEVAGTAALSVDPYDVAALAAAIRRIDGDATLRLRLSDAGRAQAARFSLDEHRRRLHAVYAQVLASPPR